MNARYLHVAQSIIERLGERHGCDVLELVSIYGEQIVEGGQTFVDAVIEGLKEYDIDNPKTRQTAQDVLELARRSVVH
jgi:hypothetical protein